ncbi:MAG: ibr finger domain [Lasallia pustulata]|uniref:RBR-type E3 ubiquitin transferase n=1 Tax=Lasallia pustulata TaxID=136370 RepID=A0A5M8PNG8_9LECA|nr:MAG: ibr finger domain [Lasallia pustulata]
MDCGPGRTRAHARLTYILTGALHQFIEGYVQKSKGKGKALRSDFELGLDSIVEDAERLLLRAQAIAAYALRLDDSGNLVDGEPRTAVFPNVAETEGPQPHAAPPSLQLGTDKEALATIFTFSPPPRAPPSPPPTTEKVVTASSLSQSFHDPYPEACVWPARLPPTPTSVKPIRRKPVPSEIASRTVSGDAFRRTSPPLRLPLNAPGNEASKAIPLPTVPTRKAVQRDPSTPWSLGIEEETVVDPLTGLPAQRETGFEPGPSSRPPGPIKGNPFRRLPTQAPPITHMPLIRTDPNEWWATQEIPVLPRGSSLIPQKISSVSETSAENVSGTSADNVNYPSLASSRMPGAGRSRPPSYVEFEPDNATEANNTIPIKELLQTKKGSVKHLLKPITHRPLKTQTEDDAALTQRLQYEEDQRLRETEEQMPRGSLTQTSRSPLTREGRLRQATAADDSRKLIASQEEHRSLGAQWKATQQRQYRREEEHRLKARRRILTEKDIVRLNHSKALPGDDSAVLTTLPGENERLMADLKAAQALQAELEEEVRQQDIRTLKELQAKLEEAEYQDARLAAQLAAEWEKEDREEIQRIREQRTTCIMCVERYKKSELFKPCSDKEHIWCGKCLHAGFKTALKTKTRLRCCRNLTTKSLPSLDPALAKQYNLMLLEMDTANPVYCSAKPCGTFIPPSAVKGDIATCPKCRKRSCVHCKASEHPDKICEQDEDTQRVLRLAQRNKWKQCPGCRNLIEKTEGCVEQV